MEDIIYDSGRVKNFFEHLALAYKKYEKKGFAKEKLNQHLEKVKNLALDKKASKRKIESNFKLLEQQIQNAISIEKEMLSKGDNKLLNKELKSRISSLEDKLDKYTKLIQGRKQRIKKLEIKIKKAARNYPKKAKSKTLRAIIIENKADDAGLRNKLLELEERYYDLKLEGFSEQQLKHIKEKIKKLKGKV
jgi:hypothetical protein